MKLLGGNIGRAIAYVMVAFAAAALAVAGVRYLSFLTSLDNTANDLRVAIQPAEPASKDIVVVALDEATLAQFPYRSPVDRGFLADLLVALQNKGAKVIGLDVILDQPTEEAKDVRLAQVIRDLNTPLFVSYTIEENVVNEDQLAYMNAFVPAERRAAANLLTDPFDGSVRRIYPGASKKDEPLGFVYKALSLAGKPITTKQQVEIAWRPRPDAEAPAFPIYPANAAAFLPDDWIRGKIVLVGAIVSMTDRHRTPLAVYADGDDAMMPGILVQAHGIAQYLEDRKPAKPTLPTVIAVSALFAALGVIITLFKRGIIFNMGLGAVLIVAYWVGAIYGYAYGWAPMVPLVAPTFAFALSLWMMDALIGKAERKQREFVQGAFSRYVSPAVVSQLVKDPTSVSISGTRREATFIFTDIAGFTTLSELLGSEQLSDVLNEYLDGACEIILKYEGTIDKFIGDAIMAIFNAPIPQADHAERAVKCALELDVYAEAFRKRQNEAGVPIGVTRIGVHCGVATIGNFGSHSRMDFTALGDTVNTAARTEGVNKYFGTRICCTDEVVKRCPDLFFRPIGDIVLKGKTEPVTLYSPVSEADAKSDLAKAYAASYELLKLGTPDAADAVRALHDQYPDDPIATFHYERVKKGLVTNLVVMEDK
ncbi:CHASE2 domain-containing protein [Sphingoaurantiacus capsulatus]|uniref:CHASE2 domain-containing protein n=1 Tax=Sphingoaurantiacus capsulatus TaxID=1771310 RepID=A0ABV7XB88_9SPHN